VLSDKDLGWLAGIVDGEGCIVVNLQENSRLVRVCITNTDTGILSEVERILDLIGIYKTKRMKQKEYANRKQCYTVEVNRQADATHLLKIIKPYMKSSDKINKAEQLIDYVDNYIRVDGKKSNRRKLGDLVDALI
jgi:hypothetical protein